MENFIIVDLETTSFTVESGIREVALMVIENNKPIEKLHLGKIEDEKIINLGKGKGYELCSENQEFIEEFKLLIDKYKYPLIAHNASFDRKFLVYYNWIDKDYIFYDSLRAIKNEDLGFESYSLENLRKHIGIEVEQTHTAMEDVDMLWEIIKYFKPKKWIEMGMASKTVKGSSKYERLTALKEEYEIIENKFDGKIIVFTGKTQYSRNDLLKLAKQYGAIAKDSISKKTDILVFGEEAGSKLEKAKLLGTECISIYEFIRIIEVGVE